MVFRNLAVLTCMFTCAASAFARAEFASLAQAQAAFATEDPADRERAYRYVLDAAGAADGRDASARLQVLRTMAVALGRVPSTTRSARGGSRRRTRPCGSRA